MSASKKKNIKISSTKKKSTKKSNKKAKKSSSKNKNIKTKKIEPNKFLSSFLNTKVSAIKGYEHLIPNIDNNYCFSEQAMNIALDIEEKEKVFLIGHTGVGKTSMIEQMAARKNQAVLRINLNQQTTESHFLGYTSLTGQKTVWVDGALPLAMKLGFWLIIDEVDYAEANILSILNPVLEKNGKLVVKEDNNNVITPHPNFRIFATANAAGAHQEYRHLYQGTNLLNEAFLDRWRCYLVNYLDAGSELSVLTNTLPTLSSMTAENMVKVANLVRNSFEKQEITSTFGTRRLLDWAKLVVRFSGETDCYLKAAENSIFSKVSRDDAYVVKEIILRVMKK